MCLLLGVNVSTSLRNKRPEQKTFIGFQKHEVTQKILLLTSVLYLEFLTVYI